jgi:malonate transporter and related proteins
MTIFAIIFPLIFMVALGYSLTRLRFFTKEQIGGISKFTFYVSIPAFLFINMLAAPLSQSFDVSVLLSFYLPVLVVFTLGYRLNRHFSPLQYRSRDASAVFALGSSYSNTVLVGLPIIIAALGEAMIGQVFMIITFHSAILFALTFILAARAGDKGFSWRKFGRNMVLNPVVLSISLGIVANALGLSLVYAMGQYLFGLTPQTLTMLVLLSASPLGVNAYLIATELKQHEATLGSTVVLSTLLSVLSFSLWLAVLL